jgi:hypothetical protein
MSIAFERRGAFVQRLSRRPNEGEKNYSEEQRRNG